MWFHDVCGVVCFFFKQKTAYEMRISDWSSDVCSSDLRKALLGRKRCQRLGPLRGLFCMSAELGERRTVHQGVAEAVEVGQRPGGAQHLTAARLCLLRVAEREEGPGENREPRHLRVLRVKEGKGKVRHRLVERKKSDEHKHEIPQSKRI